MNGADSSPDITAVTALGTLLFFNLLAIVSIINVVHPFYKSFPEISRIRFILLIEIR